MGSIWIKSMTFKKYLLLNKKIVTVQYFIEDIWNAEYSDMISKIAYIAKEELLKDTDVFLFFIEKDIKSFMRNLQRANFMKLIKTENHDWMIQ